VEQNNLGAVSWLQNVFVMRNEQAGRQVLTEAGFLALTAYTSFYNLMRNQPSNAALHPSA
jgi:hypothetical protein